MVYLIDSWLSIVPSMFFAKIALGVGPEIVKELMHLYGWESHILSQENADILSQSLGVNIEVNDTTFELDENDIENTFIIGFSAKVFENEGIVLSSFYIIKPELFPKGS